HARQNDSKSARNAADEQNFSGTVCASCPKKRTQRYLADADKQAYDSQYDNNDNGCCKSLHTHFLFYCLITNSGHRWRPDRIGFGKLSLCLVESLRKLIDRAVKRTEAPPDEIPVLSVQIDNLILLPGIGLAHEVVVENLLGRIAFPTNRRIAVDDE